MTNEEAKVFLDNLKICIDEHPVVADWLVEIADRKTESNSEIPNNCGPQMERPCNKCEWYQKYGKCVFDYCHYEYEQAHKDEPKTQMKTQNSNLTFEKDEVEDEPQTEKGGCTNCDGKDLCNNAFTEISQYCGAYEPQNGYQTFNGTSVYVSRLEDEPQTDNGIGCSRCGVRYDCCDRDMPHAVHCNNYGKITDEPQSDCPWK